MSIEELRGFIVAKSGKPISHRYKETEFERHDKRGLLKWVYETTSWIPENDERFPFKIRIWALLNNIHSLSYCKTCGKLIHKINDTRERFMEYCNSDCMFDDPNLPDKIKERWKLVDKDLRLEKTKATNLKNTGYEFPSQRPEHKASVGKKTRERQLSKEKIEMLDNREFLYDLHVNQKKNLVSMGEIVGVFYGTIREYLDRHGIPYTHDVEPRGPKSKAQIEIENFIESVYDGEIISCDRSLGIEMDVYLPEIKVAFEYNGIYYHSDTFVDKKYHLRKLETILANGIKIMNINEDDWRFKKDIVKSMIVSRIGLNERVYARSCGVVKLDTEQQRKFFDTNHIRGYRAARHCYGLMYNGEILSAMSFGVCRYDSNHEWEIIRSASKQNVTVVGGISKIISYFMVAHEGHIMTYADRMYGEGQSYESAGMQMVKSTGIDYYWSDKVRLFNRQNFTKKNIVQKFGDEYSDMSESEAMYQLGYVRFWGCGSNIYSTRK